MQRVYKPSTEKLMRYTLGALLLLIAANAFGGGFYGMAGAKDVPVEWLKNSPFHSYFIPSLVLFVCVGGTALFAGIAVFKQLQIARKAAFFCAVIMIGWITVQIAMIGCVSWLQPAIVISAVIIFIFTWLLPEYGH